MKLNPILDSIRDSYVRHAHETENAVFSMLMTKVMRDKIDLENFNLMEIFKSVHEQSQKNMSISFRDAELVISNKYEIHSVSASTNDEGEREVMVHMYNTQTNEVSSKRISEIMNLNFLFTLIEYIHEKCDLTLNLEEDED
jgi:hypothetical protein